MDDPSDEELSESESIALLTRSFQKFLKSAKRSGRTSSDVPIKEKYQIPNLTVVSNKFSSFCTIVLNIVVTRSLLPI